MVVDQILEDGIRPDLLVSTANGQRLAVIEVIVTHAPEDAALAVYDRLGLPVIRVWPTWDMLTTIRSGPAPPWKRVRDEYILLLRGGRNLPVPSPPHDRHRSVPDLPKAGTTAERRNRHCEMLALGHYLFNVLDVIDGTDADPVLIAAGCPELTDVKAIAASRGVLLATKHSKAAGGSYPYRISARCRTSAPRATTSCARPAAPQPTQVRRQQKRRCARTGTLSVSMTGHGLKSERLGALDTP